MFKKIAFGVIYLSLLTCTDSSQVAMIDAVTKSNQKTLGALKVTKKKQTSNELAYLNTKDRNVILYISRKYKKPYPLMEKYFVHIKKCAKENNIDPYIIVSVIETESSFDTNVRSRHGAIGLMQLMPATAKNMGSNPKKLTDYRVNIELGVKYLAKHLDNYKSLKLALTAYNQGATRVNNKKYTLKYFRKVTRLHTAMIKNAG